MELKLVYRLLRQLSRWALIFYSEMTVTGREHVPQYGPLIIVACHHNELLDIATLAITIPHGRPLCFWAKSSLFRNPFARQILFSSGSIPVQRDPNKQHAAGSVDNAHDALFRETFEALDRGEVVVVFPEGTSYTLPHIAQVKDGAAFAAAEYVRWRGERADDDKKLWVIPVGIVHTDKTQYLSRVAVNWGEPVDVASFAGGRASQDDLHALVKDLTSEFKRRLTELTINAPNWDMLCAAKMARTILYGSDDNIPLAHFAQASQTLIDLFIALDTPASLANTIKALLTYYSLLHYSSITHDALTAVLPPAPSAGLPTPKQAVGQFCQQLSVTLLHPRFLSFLPPLILHAPAYTLGHLAKRMLASPREAETHAQFKAIFGMVGAGVIYVLAGAAAAHSLNGLIESGVASRAFSRPVWGSTVLLRSLQRLGLWAVSPDGQVKNLARSLAVAYGMAWVLSRWHSLLVASNYKQFKRLMVSYKVMAGLLSHPSADLGPEELALYSSPPRPPANPFIKHSSSAPADGPSSNTIPINGPEGYGSSDVHDREDTLPPIPPSPRLIRPLLAARVDAMSALADFLDDVRMQPSELHSGSDPTSRTVALLQQLGMPRARL